MHTPCQTHDAFFYEEFLQKYGISCAHYVLVFPARALARFVI
jgi:hypothetical protein